MADGDGAIEECIECYEREFCGIGHIKADELADSARAELAALMDAALVVRMLNHDDYIIDILEGGTLWQLVRVDCEMIEGANIEQEVLVDRGPILAGIPQLTPKAREAIEKALNA